MNKCRISGLLLFGWGLFLIFKYDNSGSGWLINALIAVVVGLGFILTTFGRLNFMVSSTKKQSSNKLDFFYPWLPINVNQQFSRERIYYTIIIFVI